ncbi:N acetyl D glucosamine kinase [Fasciolopsis buskii]|uniref:N-acetyl-D-glucosamine kinase n=1 Tax=Fasciolopsis buskii TaxID=27845 RepID=A0A8E0VH41_9TREM|nr:N acetyl D glucosamine kinase [Fasciolopsis buski]
MELFGGIEGGTTGSRMIIVDINGQLLGSSEGPHTNHWHLGMEEAAQRLVNLCNEALADAKLPPETQLKSLGMSLSGLNTEENVEQIILAVRRLKPKIAEKLNASNDAVGTLATATDRDAIVLIAGTGSICKLIRRSLSFVRIGGLGYLLGDEGSAFWVAHQAIMCYMKTTEGFMRSPYPTQKLTEAIYRHFKIKHHHDLLPYFGEKFDKTFIAMLCRHLAEAAHDGDLFCKELFHDAGFQLGRHVSAAVRYADKEGLMKSDGMDVICCGSVFKSWDLIESGFRAGLRPRYSADCSHGRLFLRLLQHTAAYGAAIIAAKVELGYSIPRPKNVTRLICEISLTEADPIRDP